MEPFLPPHKMQIRDICTKHQIKVTIIKITPSYQCLMLIHSLSIKRQGKLPTSKLVVVMHCNSSIRIILVGDLISCLAISKNGLLLLLIMKKTLSIILLKFSFCTLDINKQVIVMDAHYMFHLNRVL